MDFSYRVWLYFKRTLRFTPSAYNVFVVCIAWQLAACVAIPNSGIIGQTALSPGSGSTEVAVSVGSSYTSTSNSSVPTQGFTTRNTLLRFPIITGNIQYGLSNAFAITVRGDEASIAPGLKMTVLRGPISIAILPSAGGGIAISTRAASNIDAWNLVGRFQLIASFHDLFYTAIGYQYTHFSESSSDSASGDVSIDGHSLQATLGYAMQLRDAHFFFEIGGGVSPAITVNASNNGGGTSDQLTDWHIICAITLALRSSPIRP